MDSYLTFDLPVYFKVKPRSWCLFWSSNIYNLVCVMILKLIFCMNDCRNTCYKIHVWDLTLTFISRSYLGQKPVKTGNA
jgi:hypothetical protein